MFDFRLRGCRLKVLLSDRDLHVVSMGTFLVVGLMCSAAPGHVNFGNFAGMLSFSRLPVCVFDFHNPYIWTLGHLTPALDCKPVAAPRPSKISNSIR